MSKKQAKIEELEKYVEFLRDSKTIESRAMNHPSTEVVAKSDYNTRVSSIDYSHYIQHADLHYFIARQLFMHHIGSYAFFCAHQAVENYLKAYLKHQNDIPQNTHKLRVLLNRCRNLTADPSSFLHSDIAQTIIEHFEPFYELARYPVQNVRPQNGQFVMFFPDGIKILDLFVYRMREIVSPSPRGWDLMTKGHIELQLCEETHPNFYDVFKNDNINFINE